MCTKYQLLRRKRSVLKYVIDITRKRGPLINNTIQVTEIGMPPLIAAPPTDWPILLTILMQAQHISAEVVGANRKTVISLDMGLYLQVKKLKVARNDLYYILLGVGELNVVIAHVAHHWSIHRRQWY